MSNSRAVVFLSPNRTTPGGWQAFRHHLEFSGDAKEFLVELCASGSSILCFDNLDFFSEHEKATVKDLVRATKNVPGVRIIATCRTRLALDEPNWLPANILEEIGHAPVVTIGELSDQEVDELTAEDPKLGALLKDDHPAKQVARNLFRLSRLVLLKQDEARLRTEVDLVKLWWTTADGRKDDALRDRQRILIAMAKHYVQSDGLFSTTEYSARALDELIGSETILDHGSDEVSFKHDILREWAVACLFDINVAALDAIDLVQPGSKSQLRSYELQTQMVLEASRETDWVNRLRELSRKNVHSSWYRAALLAIVHSEVSDELLSGMTAELLAEEAAIAKQLVSLVVATESQSFREMFPQLDGKLAKVAEGVVAPKNATWGRLIVWLLKLDQIPNQLVPAAASIMRHWMIGLGGWAPFAEVILTQFCNWLIDIETAKYPRSFRDRLEPFDNQLSSEQLNNLEENLRRYLCVFADKAPATAAKYLSSTQDRNLPDHVISDLLKTNGTLAKAAPEELANLTKNVLIVSQASSKRRREDYDEGTSNFDSNFLPASPAQGPFFALLTHCPDEGLKLVDDLVNHVIDIQIEKWGADGEVIILSFDGDERAFRYVESFHWSRNSRSYSVTSALMALEAWGHQRIESGNKPLQVALDILGLNNPSVAVLVVAIDVLLSSDQTTFSDLIPLLASPELVAMDRTRPHIQDADDFDLFGLASLQKEPAGEVSKSYLKRKASRRICLEEFVPQFAFRAGKKMRETLSKRLREASDRLGQPELGVTYADPRLMALYLRCQLDLQNYVKTETIAADGKTVEAMLFNAPPELARYDEALEPSRKASSRRFEENSIEWNSGAAVENSSRGSPELAASAFEFAIRKTTDDKQTLDFIAATALLVLRDGDAKLKAEQAGWAVEKLSELGTQEGDYHDGPFSLLRYNRAALALTGLCCALTIPLTDEQLRPILKTASKHPGAVAPGMRISLEKLTTVDPRILKSIVRVVIGGSIYPWRDWSDESAYETRKARFRARIGKTIEAEINWLLHGANEPTWPELPQVKPKIRDSIRLGKKAFFEANQVKSSQPDEAIPNPDHLIFDDSSASKIILATTPTVRSDWLQEFLDSFWPFTQVKNGVDADGERVDPPREWNDCYYTLLAEALPKLELQQADSMLNDRLISLPNESFIGAVAPFLQHLDDMTFGDSSVSVELAVSYREAVAERMMMTSEWQRLIGDTSNSMSISFRPAISSLFFNTADAFQPTQSQLLELGIQRLDPAIPLLTKCIISAPSYAVAVFTMNLVEVVFKKSHKPLVLALATSCLTSGINDQEFWLGTNMGAKICTYFVEFLGTLEDREDVETLARELDDIISRFILIGIPEGQRLYDVLNLDRNY